MRPNCGYALRRSAFHLLDARYDRRQNARIRPAPAQWTGRIGQPFVHDRESPRCWNRPRLRRDVQARWPPQVPGPEIKRTWITPRRDKNVVGRQRTERPSSQGRALLDVPLRIGRRGRIVREGTPRRCRLDLGDTLRLPGGEALQPQQHTWRLRQDSSRERRGDETPAASLLRCGAVSVWTKKSLLDKQLKAKSGIRAKATKAIMKRVAGWHYH